MSINVALTEEQKLDPDTDPLWRDRKGYIVGASPEELLLANRGPHLLGARAKRERYFTLSWEGLVVAAAKIDDIVKLDQSGRSEIWLSMMDPDDEALRQLMGREIPWQRNPISYQPDTIDSAPNTCICGCGGEIMPNRISLPGHDQKAIHDRINRIWGGTTQFVRWCDENPDIKV